MNYICPAHQSELEAADSDLVCPSGCRYPFTREDGVFIASFESTEKEEQTHNAKIYSGEETNEIYRNFLNWMFGTSKTTDAEFRKSVFDTLAIPRRARVLVTGCGNGDDLVALRQLYPDHDIELAAQDISPEMVRYTGKRLAGEKSDPCELTISNACRLPYADGQFDLAYHLGGINFMGNVKDAISEMTRVVKDGGQVAFIDEGVAPWLRESEYGKMMINNNRLWECHAPLELLPFNASKVEASWLLGNCFYFIRFIKDGSFPDVDLEIPHIGKRGGTIKTRYFGQLEGVTGEAKNIAVEAARNRKMSLSDWLDELIRKKKD